MIQKKNDCSLNFWELNMKQVAQAHPWQYDGNNDDESTIKMINSHDVTSDATKKVVLQYFEN